MRARPELQNMPAPRGPVSAYFNEARRASEQYRRITAAIMAFDYSSIELRLIASGDCDEFLPAPKGD